MRRRDFITILGGVAAAWPVAASAQTSRRLRRIAFLQPLAEKDPEAQANVSVFRQQLAQLGWTERDIQIEHRFAKAISSKCRNTPPLVASHRM